MSDGDRVLRVHAAGDSGELLAPSVGIFTPSVAHGELVASGQSIGTIDVLGVRCALLVPEGVAGRVTHRLGGTRTRVPVQYGDALITVSTASVSDVSAAGATSATEMKSAISFAAPMSGRFYSRPSPNDPAFVSVGEGVEGLVHVSEIAMHHVESPELELSIGQQVRVKVTEIDADRRRVSLSIKQALPEWEERSTWSDKPARESRPKRREFTREEDATPEPSFNADSSLEAILQELKERGIGRG